MRKLVVPVIALILSCKGDPPPATVGSGGRGGGGGSEEEVSCPVAVDFEITASASSFDRGWTGLGHGGVRDSGAQYRLELFDCDEECRRCRLRGPIEGPAPSSQKRCFNDMRQRCSKDADCSTYGGPAEYQVCRFSNTLVSFSSSGQPTCVTGVHEPDGEGYAIRGTFDTVTGATAITRANGSLGAAVGTFCQDCVGDATPNDGVKDGACEASGEACDVHFLSGGATSDFAVSYDCMLPNPAQPGELGFYAVVLPDNRSDVASTPRQLELGQESPNCGAAGHEGEKCHCGVCESTMIGCQSDADCPPGVTCGAFGNATKPDDCADTCSYDATAQRHTCTNGNGMTVGCFPSASPVPIPGSNENRGDFYALVLGNAACLGPSGQASDAIVGLPGLLRNVEAVRATLVRE